MNPIRGRISIAVFCVSALAPASASALEPIDTDGPDFVESSEAVPKGHFQYEVDFTSVRDRRTEPHATAVSTPTLLKYGIADNVEIRVAPEGFVREEGRSGLGDTALGIKWHAQDRNTSEGRPALSWIVHADMASGANQFRGYGVRPSLRSVMTWDLPHDLALGLMPGIKYDSDASGHRYTSVIFGAVLNKRFTERMRGFVEFSAPQIASGHDGGVLASWDIGAAYLLSNDFQLGVRAGIAANRNTPTSYVLLELAQRF